MISDLSGFPSQLPNNVVQLCSKSLTQDPQYSCKATQYPLQISLSSLPGENKYRKDQNPCSFKSSSLQTDAKEYYFCLFASQENNRDRRVLEHCGRERERSEKAKQSKAEQRSRERGTERERDRRGSYIANFGVFCNFVSPPHLHSLSFFSPFSSVDFRVHGVNASTCPLTINVLLERRSMTAD